MNIFRFKIQGYDAKGEKHYTNTGLGVADSYGKAASILEEYFGDELRKILHLELYEEENLIFMTEQMVEEYANFGIPGVDTERIVGFEKKPENFNIEGRRRD